MEKHFSVYIVRHGESLFNLKKITQGICDSPLTEKGIEQAKVLGKAWENKHFDKYIISNLGRVEATFQNIRPDTDYVRTPLLHEVSMGTAEGDPYSVVHWDHMNIGFGEYDGETKEQIVQRVHQLLDYLVEKADDGDEIMCVSHGLYIAWIAAVLLDKSYDEIMKDVVYVKNCSVTKITYDGQFHLEQINSLDYKQFL